MHRLIFITTLCVLLCFPFAVRAKDYTVTRVINGHTVQLDSGETVKYLGVETPSLNVKDGSSEFFAREAKRFNHKLVFMKKVRLEFDKQKTDQEGNLLAYLYVKKTFVNGELIRLGYGKATNTPPNERYKEMFQQYEKEAMAGEKGLWQEKKKDTEKVYIGNKRLSALHRPTCKLVDKISDKNRIVFRNRSDAIKIGYIPCKVCKP